MPFIAIAIAIGSSATSGPSGPQISAHTLQILDGVTPVTSGGEGDETALIATVSGVDTLDSDDSTALGVTVTTTDVDLYRNNVLVGAMADQGGGTWTLGIAGAADPLLAADTGTYTARRTATVDATPVVRNSAGVAFTVTLVTATLTPSDTTPDEGDDVTFAAAVNFGTITEARFYDHENELVDTVTEADWETVLADIIPGSHAGWRVELDVTEAGARVVHAVAATVEVAPEAPTLDLPVDAGTVDTGDTTIQLEASGTVDGFDDNTTLMRWLARVNGGSWVQIGSNGSAPWEATGDLTALGTLEEDDSIDVKAERTYSLAQGGTDTIDSAAVVVSVVVGVGEFTIPESALEGTSGVLTCDEASPSEFDVFVDDAYVATVSAEPWQYEVTDQEPGSYTIQAKRSGVAVSPLFTVNVAARAPVPTAPTENEEFDDGDPIPWAADVYDPDVTDAVTARLYDEPGGTLLDTDTDATATGTEYSGTLDSTGLEGTIPVVVITRETAAPDVSADPIPVVVAGGALHAWDSDSAVVAAYLADAEFMSLSGSDITSWAAQKGGGTYGALTGVNGPQWDATACNGNGAVLGNGSTRHFRGDALAAIAAGDDTPITIVTLQRHPAAMSGTTVFVGFGDADQANPRMNLRVDSNERYSFARQDTSTAVTAVTTQTYGTTAWRVVVWQFLGTTCTIDVDGSATSVSGSSLNRNAIAFDQCAVLAAIVNGTVASHVDADLSAVLFCTSVPTNLAAIVAELMTRAGTA